MTSEQYKCPSYYDNNRVLQDCACGKCGTPDKIEKIIDEYLDMVKGTAHMPLEHWLRTTLTKYHQDLMSEVETKLNEAIQVVADDEFYINPTKVTELLTFIKSK